MLAMGKPIIAGDNPANRELLEHKVNAYLIKPGDQDALAYAIDELYHDHELRRKLANGARQLYIDRCSEAMISKQLSGLYSELLEKR
jgi:glycosyltransferase involved in cell wall biosynthesis